MSARLVEKKHGLALVGSDSLTPFAYERGGKLVFKVDSRKLELSPEDLERLAKELRERKLSTVWRARLS